MLFAFGDSFTYGFNFDENERVNSVYPSIMGGIVGQDVCNTAIVGGSNWRIARQLQSMSLTQDDIAVIAWSTPNRFEFGVSKTHYNPPAVSKKLGDMVEVSGRLIVKRFYEQLTERTADPVAKTLNAVVYNDFNNAAWFEEMFKVMFTSCVYALEKSGCQWVMFNTWDVQSGDVSHKNYLHSDKTMSEIIGAHRFGYWDKDQHRKVASVLVQELDNLYG